jgi:hypothetical protein
MEVLELYSSSHPLSLADTVLMCIGVGSILYLKTKEKKLFLFFRSGSGAPQRGRNQQKFDQQNIRA